MHRQLTYYLQACFGIFLFLVNVPLVLADDIDVFAGSVSSHYKPNVLLVLDMSDSMLNDVNDNDPYDTGLPSKLDILREAVFGFLDRNINNLRVGFLDFNFNSSGVKWPVSDLDDLASNIDSAIPDKELRVVDLLKNQINTLQGKWQTNTVSALVEAGLYYSGGEVAAGGVPQTKPNYFIPPTWNDGYKRYHYEVREAPLPVTYVPQDAFEWDVYKGYTTSCRDFTLGGTVAGVNECQGWTGLKNCTYVAEFVREGHSEADVVPAHTWCEKDYPHYWAGANYVSPIQHGCQQNIVLVISDGEPTLHWNYNAETRFLGHSVQLCEDVSSSLLGSADNKSGNCGLEAVRKMFQHDQLVDIPGSNVVTHAIGFSISTVGADYLKSISSEGGGQFYQANNLESLNSALASIGEQLQSKARSFNTPSIDTNRSNFSHDNRVYMSLFKPSAESSWEGNLKGYFFDENGLKDVNGNSATIKRGTGTYFSDSAQSFWSEEPDGDDASLGGASGKLNPDNRNLYTYLSYSVPAGGAPLKSVTGEHNISATARALSPEIFGLGRSTTETEKKLVELIDWLYAAPMGAPLHSNNVVLNYADRKVAYVMTNRGLLHAIDVTLPVSTNAEPGIGGDEIFAYMPAELLGNVKKMAGFEPTAEHIYGLDGTMTHWHNDNNMDGIVNGDDTVRIIFGMRRGGSHYYAIDVTNPENPIFKWQISGGKAPFDDLAQTWSRVSIITVNASGAKKRVAVFGGGYDADANDGASARTPGKGNAIYMVDENGKLLWKASHPSMRYSIPADIVPIDSDGDGYADRLFTADTGGNVWRVDIGKHLSSSSIKVTHLADLGADSYQPFFYPPSISLENGFGSLFYGIAIGSGDRTDPLKADSDNRLFLIRDTETAAGPPTSDRGVIHTSDLFNTTDNRIGSGTLQAEQARQSLSEKSGWYINLNSGEKILSRVVTLESQILATSFYQTAANSSECGTARVGGRYYAVEVTTGEPGSSRRSGGVDNVNRHESSSAEERYTELDAEGILTTPSLLTLPGTPDVKVMVDNQIVDSIAPTLNQVFWFPIE